MPCSPTFVEHALELLVSAGPVDARRMFGGYGIYSRGVMFGLLDDDELFLKTDAESRARFLAAGCRMWIYPGASGGETSYYRPPDEAHEDEEAMGPWARLGLDAALRLQAAKRALAAAKAARRAEREVKKGKPVKKGKKAESIAVQAAPKRRTRSPAKPPQAASAQGRRRRASRSST